MSAFKISGTPTQVAWVEEALAECTFDFDRIVPGLRRQTGRSQVDVSYRNLGGGVGGMASSSGWIQLNTSLGKQAAKEVFVMEACHSVDFFLATDAQRQQVYDLFHPAGKDSHSWFEPSTYWNQVGEAMMYLFVWAYTPYRPQSSFAHKPTEETAAKLRGVLGGGVNPPPPPPPLPPPPPPPGIHPTLDVVYTGTVGGRAVTLKGTLAPAASGGTAHPTLTGPLTGSVPRGGILGGTQQLSLTGTAAARTGPVPPLVVVPAPDAGDDVHAAIDWRKYAACVLAGLVAGKPLRQVLAECLAG